MRKTLTVISVILICIQSLNAQIFTYKRESPWLADVTPRFGLMLTHTGIDDSYGQSAADLFRWGAGLTGTFGFDGREFGLNTLVRMEYQQAHANGKLPIKGPSIFQVMARPLYKLFRPPAMYLNLSFQIGLLTALLPEMDEEGETISEFFNPAATYEGLYLDREDVLGLRNDLRLHYQVGYAFQQLHYRDPGRLREQLGYPAFTTATTSAYSAQSSTSIADNGVSALFSLDYRPLQILNEQQRLVAVFSAMLDVRLFKKEGVAGGIAQSRVEGYLNTSLTLWEHLEFLNSIELIYDSAISKRRQLRSSVSINYRYMMDLNTF
jgi:hypothetical protein